MSRESVEGLLESIASILRIAGIPEAQINVAQGFDYKTHHFAKAFDWLHDFILSSEMDRWKAIRALRPEGTWLNYYNIGVEGLAEQVLLQEASRNLQKRWRQKRPRMFGPNRNVENNLQSDQTNFI